MDQAVTKPTNPYVGLPPRRFWSTGVASSTPATIAEIYTPKFSISGKRIATAGSCFAQEIAKALRDRKFDVMDTEPAPSGTHSTTIQKFSYGQYSARFGNIYTSRHLVQLAEEALGLRSIPPNVLVWERDGRFYDAMRPGVEPNGLPTPELVLMHRADHLKRVRQLIEQCDIFVFTLGLTETWVHRETGVFFQSTPGVIAGHYDPEAHEFRNMRYSEILADMLRFRDLLQSVNPNAHILLTVSPVPLTATYEDRHVLVSTVRSKSILRTVAAELSETFEDIDYFPSFEMLSTAYLGPALFKPNRRNVTPEGVAAVMESFFAAHKGEKAVKPSVSVAAAATKAEDEAACEDALLEGFAPR